MARQGLVARPTRRRRRGLTRPDKAAPPIPDLVKRDFTAPAINHKWCGDLTEVPTEEGKLYLATVEDLASRRIVGFGLSEHHDAELATAALKMAVAVRGGAVAGTIFHTDRGSEYSAELYASACARCGITQSMGRAGSCFDNAAAESWFSTLEWELFRTTPFPTKQAARREIAKFIDWYNRIRRHSSCEMKAPIEFEAILAARRPNHSPKRRRHENRAPQSPERPATRSVAPDTGPMTGSISNQQPSTIRGEAQLSLS